MSVTFDNITFDASTVQGSSQQGGENEPTPVTPTYSVGDTYTGDFISITIPDALPVVQASSSTFNLSKCNLFLNDSEWCIEAEKKYNGLDYDENFDEDDIYYEEISYFLDNVYIVTNATPQTITEIGTGQ